MKNHGTTIAIFSSLIYVVNFVGITPAFAQGYHEIPDEMEGVEIVERLNEQIPLDLAFVDENNRNVTMQKYFDGERPVILSLIYFRCPMLCGLVLNGMLDGLKDMEMTPGDEFEIVTVSIDPLETPTLAKMKKQNYMKEYNRPAAAKGWHFLTGKEDNIKALANSVGFHYKYNEKTKEYVHDAAIFILTPDGKISRYLYNIVFEPRTLELSLIEASEGKIGTTIDRFILTCFMFDPDSNSYVPVAMGIMRVGGFFTLLFLGSFLVLMWMRERTRKGSNTLESPAA